MNSKINRFHPAVWLLGMVLLALTACSPDMPAAETPGVDIPTSPPADSGGLVGTRWELVSFEEPGGEDLVIPGPDLTLSFAEDGQVSGEGGCNSFGGQYHVEDSSLAFRELIRTLRGCADDRFNAQENRYLQALEAAGRFELSGDQLKIFYGDGTLALNFSRLE